jgi:hypothetical protein
MPINPFGLQEPIKDGSLLDQVKSDWSLIRL